MAFGITPPSYAFKVAVLVPYCSWIHSMQIISKNQALFTLVTAR